MNVLTPIPRRDLKTRYARNEDLVVIELGDACWPMSRTLALALAIRLIKHALETPLAKFKREPYTLQYVADQLNNVLQRFARGERASKDWYVDPLAVGDKADPNPRVYRDTKK